MTLLKQHEIIDLFRSALDHDQYKSLCFIDNLHNLVFSVEEAIFRKLDRGVDLLLNKAYQDKLKVQFIWERTGADGMESTIITTEHAIKLLRGSK